MRVLVTGATGLLGRSVVRALLGAGHDVDAVIRPSSAATLREAGSSRMRPVRLDLRSDQGLHRAVDAVDGVVHAAALKSGDLASQFAVTVRGTERLLDAMARVPGRRLVAVSSMSVYDLYRVPQGHLVSSDSTPLDVDGPHRDEYARAKLFQERLTSEAHECGIADVVTLRPGIIVGLGEAPLHPLLGTWVGRTFIVVGRQTTPPLASVDNVARAVAAAVIVKTSGYAVDVVDDAIPTNVDYITALQARGLVVPHRYVPWSAVRISAELTSRAARQLLGPQARLPGVMIPSRVHARFKPLRFTNREAKRVLDWRPHLTYTATLDQMIGEGSFGT